jgi:hypothetical protein
MSTTFDAREPALAPPPPRLPTPFEFSAPQEVLIGSLGRLMRIVGVVSLVFGGLVGVLGLMARGNAIVAVVQAGMMVAIGLLTYSAGSRFRQVVDTTGRDIAHLMEALDRVRTIYLVQVWVLGIALGLLAIVLVWAMVMLATR